MSAKVGNKVRTPTFKTPGNKKFRKFPKIGTIAIGVAFLTGGVYGAVLTGAGVMAFRGIKKLIQNQSMKARKRAYDRKYTEEQNTRSYNSQNNKQNSNYTDSNTVYNKDNQGIVNNTEKLNNDIFNNEDLFDKSPKDEILEDQKEQQMEFQFDDNNNYNNDFSNNSEQKDNPKTTPILDIDNNDDDNSIDMNTTQERTKMDSDSIKEKILRSREASEFNRQNRQTVSHKGHN